MTNRPTVRKHGTWWRVYVNGRMWSSTPTFTEAIERAHGIASYARRIRFQRDLERTRAAIDRMEKPMKQKQVRQRQNAAKEAIEAYLDYMEKRCYVKTPHGACPDCVRAYEHTLHYYRQTFKENR